MERSVAISKQIFTLEERKRQLLDSSFRKPMGFLQKRNRKRRGKQIDDGPLLQRATKEILEVIKDILQKLVRAQRRADSCAFSTRNGRQS